MERVTACHGEGREPGDGKSLSINTAKASVTRSTGSRLFLSVRGVPPDCVVLPPIAIDMSPAKAGYEFRSADASQMARQTWIYRYGLMITTRNLCSLITSAGSGTYIYQPI